VQQSPWLSIANKQLEIMGRFMAELGLSPSARARLRLPGTASGDYIDGVTVKFVTVYEGEDDKDSTRPPVSCKRV
jgi:phage terminase small subunit